jgi:hypothetical protein
MDNIVMHKFRVGQTVNLVPSVLHSAATGEYEIRHLLPPPDIDPTTPRYRIKNIAEKHERVASESELTLSNRLGSVFS